MILLVMVIVQLHAQPHILLTDEKCTVKLHAHPRILLTDEKLTVMERLDIGLPEFQITQTD